MKNNLIALLSGFIFAIGLGVSGMTQPPKVIGFLNVFGEWDPSLAFVMMGAIAVHFFAYRIADKKKKPWFSDTWKIPRRRDITLSLIFGAFIFGVGWGMGGFCPGPAITSLASFQIRPIIFVASMLFGMILFRVTNRKSN